MYLVEAFEYDDFEITKVTCIANNCLKGQCRLNYDVLCHTCVYLSLNNKILEDEFHLIILFYIITVKTVNQDKKIEPFFGTGGVWHYFDDSSFSCIFSSTCTKHSFLFKLVLVFIFHIEN